MAPDPEQHQSTVGELFALDGRTRDEKPLVNSSVDRCRGQVLSSRNLRELRGVDPIWGSRVCDVGQAEITALLLARDETFPGITALADDLFSILLVLAFTTEGELVFGLSIWDLVDTEPFVGSSQEAREVTLDVFNVVQLWSKRVVDLWTMESASRKFVSARQHSHQ